MGPAERREIPGPLHAILVYFLFYVVLVAMIFGVGFCWCAYMLKRSGYRARDMLFYVVPLGGWIVMLPVLWRATSFSPYWLARPDYFSRPGSAWASPRRWFSEIGKP